MPIIGDSFISMIRFAGSILASALVAVVAAAADEDTATFFLYQAQANENAHVSFQFYA